MTLEPLFGTSDKKSQISPNLQASSTRAWKTKRSKKRKHDCCFQWQAPHKPTPRERKKKTNIHTQTHTLTHPNPWPHRVREQEPKIKERVNNKWEIKTEENYLLYAQTEKEDCSSVSVSVYCSHNAQSEKQTGRKREQAWARSVCWLLVSEEKEKLLLPAKETRKRTSQTASQPASQRPPPPRGERDKAENSRTREHAQQTTNNKHWQQHHENLWFGNFGAVILTLIIVPNGHELGGGLSACISQNSMHLSGCWQSGLRSYSTLISSHFSFFSNIPYQEG